MSRFFRYHVDHILFWMLTISFHAYTRLNLVDDAHVWTFIGEIVVRNILLAAVIYCNLWFVIPRVAAGKVLTGTLVCFISLALYMLAKGLHDMYLQHVLINQGKTASWAHSVFYNLSIVLFYLAFATALYLSKQWYVQREVLRQVQLEKLNTELEYLKAQMNPHFLFNSINTIFFQIDKQNHTARETLGKFSDMLRYQLYECNDKEIAIEKELAYLKSYVELQKLRRNDNDQIVFTIADDMRNFSVPPMLLIPFIENAFKHASSYTDRTNEININLNRRDKAMILSVRNTRASGAVSVSNGIGLKNVRRRLQLLFPERHTLDIGQTGNHFEVTLTLKIA
jgi:LytS/YehU family sensor histidine kinase